MSKKAKIKYFIYTALLVFGTVSFSNLKQKKAEVLLNTKPNIIIIYTDDQGYGDVSELNKDAKFKTPNLDRLVKEGIAFTNGHSGSSVCTPSGYSLLNKF